MWKRISSHVVVGRLVETRYRRVRNRRVRHASETRRKRASNASRRRARNRQPGSRRSRGRSRPPCVCRRVYDASITRFHKSARNSVETHLHNSDHDSVETRAFLTWQKRVCNACPTCWYGNTCPMRCRRIYDASVSDAFLTGGRDQPPRNAFPTRSCSVNTINELETRQIWATGGA